VSSEVTSTPAARPPASKSPAPGADLQSAQGTTHISDTIVEKAADVAAREVRGVHDLQSGLVGTMRRLAPGMQERGSGAAVEVGERETIIDLDLIVEWGISIPQLAEAVRANVIERVEFITGLQVKEVNIEVSDFFFAEEERRRQAQQDRESAPRVE
jgi:uncharacterized alkaline shock family protein YloU